VPKLPIVSGRDLIKVLGKVGYAVDHQTGSHVILRHKREPHRRVTVPFHGEIAKGTLRAILNEAGMTVEEFLNLL